MSANHTINYVMEYPWLVWGFALLIIIMLILDLWVFNKKNHEVSNKEALIYSIVWISFAMIFSGIVYWLFWVEKFAEFQWAYWIEKSLSVDNLFVFILVVGFFKISKQFQHKILFYWVLWAIIFRAIFIFAWVEIINLTNFILNFSGKTFEFNPILFIFWIFLIYSGIKSWKSDDEEEKKDISENFAYKLVKKFFKATDPFILYTSNIFAILGLRSLYFLLANSINLFSKLHYGLAVILSFIWLKMVIAPVYHVKTTHSLVIIAVVLVWTLVWSVVDNKKQKSL